MDTFTAARLHRTQAEAAARVMEIAACAPGLPPARRALRAWLGAQLREVAGLQAARMLEAVREARERLPLL